MISIDNYYYYADPYMIVVKMIYQNEMIFFPMIVNIMV